MKRLLVCMTAGLFLIVAPACGDMDDTTVSRDDEGNVTAVRTSQAWIRTGNYCFPPTPRGISSAEACTACQDAAAVNDSLLQYCPRICAIGSCLLSEDGETDCGSGFLIAPCRPRHDNEMAQ